MVRIIEKLLDSVVLVIPGTVQGHQCQGAACPIQCIERLFQAMEVRLDAPRKGHFLRIDGW